MSCKTTEIQVLPINSYSISLIDENWEVEPSIDTEYDIYIYPVTNYEIKARKSENDIKADIPITYDLTSNIVKTYWFRYCVSYRDPNEPERIVARWFWNDEWLWFADWIWRDE